LCYFCLVVVSVFKFCLYICFWDSWAFKSINSILFRAHYNFWRFYLCLIKPKRPHAVQLCFYSISSIKPLGKKLWERLIRLFLSPQKFIWTLKAWYILILESQSGAKYLIMTSFIGHYLSYTKYCNLGANSLFTLGKLPK